MRKYSLRKEANYYLESNKKGSLRDKRYRRFVIHNMIEDLFTLGEVPSNWNALTTKNMQQLIQYWYKKKLKSSTIMNRMTIVRKFLQNVGNNAMKTTNQCLGIKRKKSFKKLPKISPDIWQKPTDPMIRVILGLQIHFGLTLSEAIHLLPEIHVHDYKLWLTREITFNGRDRVIPFRWQIQPDLINEFCSLTQNRQNLISMQGARLIGFKWRHELQALKLPSAKSYRYFYAQQLQAQLSPLFSKYESSLIIREEMGLKSRTTLWNYLHE